MRAGFLSRTDSCTLLQCGIVAGTLSYRCCLKALTNAVQCSLGSRRSPPSPTGILMHHLRRGSLRTSSSCVVGLIVSPYTCHAKRLFMPPTACYCSHCAVRPSRTLAFRRRSVQETGHIGGDTRNVRTHSWRRFESPQQQAIYYKRPSTCR